MSRKREATGSVGGGVSGAIFGAKIGASIGIVLGPLGAMAGTIPCAIIFGTIGTLGGNKIGSELDRFFD